MTAMEEDGDRSSWLKQYQEDHSAPYLERSFLCDTGKDPGNPSASFSPSSVRGSLPQTLIMMPVASLPIHWQAQSLVSPFSGH
jgi:hypothetical protein